MVKRYDFIQFADVCEMRESEDGDYILHTDYDEAMAGKDARIKALEDCLFELSLDYGITLRNIRISAKRDPNWDGYIETVQPKIDAARSLLKGETPNARA